MEFGIWLIRVREMNTHNFHHLFQERVKTVIEVKLIKERVKVHGESQNPLSLSLSLSLSIKTFLPFSPIFFS